MRIMLVKNDSGFILPAFDSDKEKLKRFKVGEPFAADVTKPRNLKFHRKFFALLNMVLENQEIYTNIEDLRIDLTIEAGYFEERPNLHGEIIRQARSISFAAMDDLAFGEYFNAVLLTIVRCFHFDKQEILDNIEQYY